MAKLYRYAASNPKSGYFIRGWSKSSGNYTLQVSSVAAKLFDWMEYDPGRVGKKDGYPVSGKLISRMCDVGLLWTEEDENQPSDAELHAAFDSDTIEFTDEEFEQLHQFILDYSGPNSKAVEELGDLFGVNLGFKEDKGATAGFRLPQPEPRPSGSPITATQFEKELRSKLGTDVGFAVEDENLWRPIRATIVDIATYLQASHITIVDNQVARYNVIEEYDEFDELPYRSLMYTMTDYRPTLLGSQAPIDFAFTVAFQLNAAEDEEPLTLYDAGFANGELVHWSPTDIGDEDTSWEESFDVTLSSHNEVTRANFADAVGETQRYLHDIVHDLEMVTDLDVEQTAK